MAKYVYGIKNPQTGFTMNGIMTSFHVTTSGTEQDLPGQTSCDPVADSGVSDIKTTVDFDIRGGALQMNTLRSGVGSKITVSIDSEDACAGSNADDREAVHYSFVMKVTSVDVTAKQRDWWEAKVTGVVLWDETSTT